MRSKKFTEMEEQSGRAVTTEAAVPKKKRKWPKILLIILIILALLAGSAYFGVNAYLNNLLDKNIKRTKIEKKELSCVNVDGYVNILLLGVDSRSMSKKALEDANTDCIIILSLNTKTNEINLISVYRDTYLPVSDSKYGKINSAMAISSPENTIKRLNESLDLDIDNYALFNWKMVAELVDSVGGVEINVSDAEMQAVNQYIGETGESIGEKAVPLTASGKQTLDGVQAVTYGRIRKGVGDDFARTGRMRKVIKKTLQKLKKQNVTDLLKIMKRCMKYCETSMSNDDLISLAQQLSSLKINKSIGFPYTVDGGYVNGESFVFPVDLSKDGKKLHKEMFGQKDYKISDRAQKISDHIRQVYLSGGSASAYGSSEESSRESSYGSTYGADTSGGSTYSEGNGYSSGSSSSGTSGSSSGSGTVSGGDSSSGSSTYSGNGNASSGSGSEAGRIETNPAP
ncbi:MAG: LCP family protein [Eubacteriales bacterium]|nr:LCP family protein [Eubacteriales bacterium]